MSSQAKRTSLSEAGRFSALLPAQGCPKRQPHAQGFQALRTAYFLHADTDRGIEMTLDEILGNDFDSKEQLPLGEILLRRGQVRRYQLDFVLELQKSYELEVQQRHPLGELLIKHRATMPKSVEEALVLQKELPHESITQIVSRLDAEMDESDKTKLLPPELRS